MNEKEMVAHIKMLTKIIEKQNEYSDRLQRNFYNTERAISILQRKVAILEGMKDE